MWESEKIRGKNEEEEKTRIKKNNREREHGNKVESI